MALTEREEVSQMEEPDWPPYLRGGRVCKREGSEGMQERGK